MCKIETTEGVDLTRPFVFLSRTDDECSLVCETARVPASATYAEHGFNALKICGTLDFALVGIIARISSLLAEEQISVFVISTFNTDYFLVKQAKFDQAVGVLRDAGYEVG